MSRPRKKKTFDVLEFKRRTQARIHREIKDLTPAQQREYFRRGAEEGPLGDWWKSVKRNTAKRSKKRSPAA